jgi:hypothetical protein
MMSTLSSHRIPSTVRRSSRPNGPPRVELNEPISYETLWRNAVAVVPLIVIVAIVLYLIWTT